MYAKDLAQCVSLQDLLSSVSASFLCRSHIRYFQSSRCPFSAVLGPHSKPGTYRSVRLRANYSLWAESPACPLPCTPVELNNSFYIFNRNRKIVLFQRRLLSCDVWKLNEIQISGSTNKVLLKHSLPHLFRYWLYLVLEWWSWVNCNRDITHKAANIHYSSLMGSLLTFIHRNKTIIFGGLGPVSRLMLKKPQDLTYWDRCEKHLERQGFLSAHWHLNQRQRQKGLMASRVTGRTLASEPCLKLSLATTDCVTLDWWPNLTKFSTVNWGIGPFGRGSSWQWQ